MSAENGYPKAQRILWLLQHYMKGISPSCPPSPFFQRNWMFFREHGHVQEYLLWSKNPGHSGSSGHRMRQVQLFSGSWLGTIVSAGRKLWPPVPGIHQESCTVQTVEPGSSSWLSTHQMKSCSILALRLISCLASGCWAAAFSWYPQIFLIQVI